MPTNKAAIEFRVGPGGQRRKIPSSHPAAILRYLHENRDRWVSAQDIAVAIGSLEVHARLHTLRHRYEIHPLKQDRPKASGRGTYAVYRLPDEVEVWEPFPDDNEGEEGQ